MTALEPRLLDCGCCAPDADRPDPIENGPGRSSLAYRCGTHGSFRATMLGRIARTPELRSLTTREPEDPSIALHRRLGERPRRPDLLPGANRQRGLPADRHRASIRVRAGGRDRLPAQSGRGRNRLARLRARERSGGAGERRHPARREGPERPRPGRGAADLRDDRRGSRTAGMEPDRPSMPRSVSSPARARPRRGSKAPPPT